MACSLAEIQSAKNIPKKILEGYWSFSVPNTAWKNTQYSKNDMILEKWQSAHFANFKAVVRENRLNMVYTFGWTSKCQIYSNQRYPVLGSWSK